MSSPETVPIADDSGSQLDLHIANAITNHVISIGTLPDSMTLAVHQALRNGSVWNAGKHALGSMLVNGPVTLAGLGFRGLSRVEFRVTEAS